MFNSNKQLTSNYPFEEANEFRSHYSFFNSSIRFNLELLVNNELFHLSGKLFPLKAPLSVKRFILLSERGFYNGVKVAGLVNQKVLICGMHIGPYPIDPIPGEFAQNGFYDNDLQNIFGAIGMARFNEDPDSALGHFYICLDFLASLNGKQAVFGYIDKNKRFLDRINRFIHTSKDKSFLENISVEKIEIIN